MQPPVVLIFLGCTCSSGFSVRLTLPKSPVHARSGARRVPAIAKRHAITGPRLHPLQARPGQPPGFSGDGWGLPVPEQPGLSGTCQSPKSPPSANFSEPQKRRHRPDPVRSLTCWCAGNVGKYFPGTPGRCTLISGKSYEKIVHKKDPGNDPQSARSARERIPGKM